ncbi:MAG: DUF6049 family protein [Nocardioidaceae bacterium]|nr:DUF6049 family protein [Nocardioidaceae bacterium]MCL2612758.1 DUF6049 family protein [Nocardioidaceae bacterium]
MAEGRWASRAATALLGGLLLSATAAVPAADAAPAAHAAHAAPAARAASAEPRGGPHRAGSGNDSPLRIEITDLTPGTLPRQGPVQVTGTITNTDHVTWRHITVYPYLNTTHCMGLGACPGPMQSASALATGARTDPDTPVGERLVDASAMQSIPSIAPQQSVTFSLTISQQVLRRELLDPQPGVYWFGVQALGDSRTTPRDLVADGRALTFLPYVPAGYGATGRGQRPASVDTAVVVPLRAPVRHLRDGRIAGARAWLRALGESGSLGGPLAVGQAAGGLPVTWLVDPAVPDAVRQLSLGNPLRLVPAPGQSSSSSPSPSTSPSATGLASGTSGTASAGPLASAAGSWLDEVHRALGTGQLLTLPYGDTQLTGSDLTRRLYSLARAQRSVLDDWRLHGRRAVASPDGYLDPDGITKTDDHSILLLGDGMVGDSVGVGSVDGHAVAVTSTGAASGGPGPDDRYSAVSMRQRILSEAAVRVLSGDDRPLVVQLPGQMGAAGATSFWSGLSQSWLHLTSVNAVLHHQRTEVARAALRYPASHSAHQVSPSTQRAALHLVKAGRLLQSILTLDTDPDSANDRLASRVTAEALTGTSYSLGSDADAAGRLERSRSSLADQLSKVSISAPPGVTLSSSEGSFAVSVTNNLDVPVTVAVAATAEGAHVHKSAPVALAAHSRASVRLDAHTNGPGVHNIRLTLTDKDGQPIGATATVPVRSGTVGFVIWMIIGLGAAILFVAIVVRLVRRLRTGRGEAA